MEKNLTYELAYQELKKITEEIENETISIDLLAENVKRASYLIEFCQIKLRNTEKEVNNIISQMENTEEKSKPKNDPKDK